MKKYFRDILNLTDNQIEKSKPSNLKFRLSDHINVNIINKTSINENKIEPIKKDILEFNEDCVEQEEPEQKVEQLFDGYLGEKNFDPNPLEYGPNAMYRRNGTVYRKSVDNLWETYLQDGKQGPKGSASGSGIGVQEAKLILQDNLLTTLNSLPEIQDISATESIITTKGRITLPTVSVISASSYSHLTSAISGTFIGQYARIPKLGNIGSGIDLTWTGDRWEVVNGQSIICDTTELTLSSTSGMIGVAQTLKSWTIPAGMIGDNEIWEWCYYAEVVSGTSGATIKLGNGSNINFQASITLLAAPCVIDSGWRRFRKRDYTMLRGSTSNVEYSPTSVSTTNLTYPINFTTDVTIPFQITPSAADQRFTVFHVAIRRAA